jgi:hypothetical protein
MWLQFHDRIYFDDGWGEHESEYGFHGSAGEVRRLVGAGES